MSLSDEVLNTVHQMMSDGDRSRWLAGDLLLELGAELVRGPYTWGVLFTELADGTGYAADTLRDVTRLARLIPVTWRDEWEGLTRSQWTACLPAGDDLLTVASWAVESADEYGGKPAPVRVIRANVKAIKGEPEPPAPLDRAWSWLRGGNDHIVHIQEWARVEREDRLFDAMEYLLDWNEVMKDGATEDL